MYRAPLLAGTSFVCGDSRETSNAISSALLQCKRKFLTLFVPQASQGAVRKWWRYMSPELRLRTRPYFPSFLFS